MRFWREIVGDRWSGGVLSAFLVLAFLAQVAFAGHAAAALGGADPSAVICSSAPDGSHRPAAPESRHECPCAALCGAGFHMPAVLPPANGAGLPVRFAEPVPVAAEPAAPARADAIGAQHSARGPPITAIAS